MYIAFPCNSKIKMISKIKLPLDKIYYLVQKNDNEVQPNLI